MADLSLGIGLQVKWDEIEKAWAEQSKKFSDQHQIDVKVNPNTAKSIAESVTAYEKMVQAQKRSAVIQERLDSQAQVTAKRRAEASMQIAKNELNLAAIYERNVRAQEDGAKRSLLITDRINNSKRQAALIQEKLVSQETITVNRQNANIRAQELHEQRLATAKIRTNIAEQSLNKARSTSVGIIELQNRSLSRQGFLLNGVKQFAGQYISALGAFRLFENIRNTTAEFEMQRVALKAIIQDAQAADRIFNQVLSLSVKSPFTAMELTTYTKQLAAYRIETENLFDTTKRLADVSAGLGVDMSRLIIAYGQVRAASVLRGQEIRQFTEAGIPLIALLADKFSQLRGEVVTTSDVFDLVSRRQVPFEMVAEIFKDMTDSGGTFYDMQRIQSETLKGIYANLSDNIQQSFARIGNSQMDVLKNAGQFLTILAKNLEDVISLGIVGASTWLLYRNGIHRAASSVASFAKGEAAAVLSAKRKNVVLLQSTSLYRDLSVEERMMVNSRNALTAADIKSMNVSAPAKREIALRAIATGKLAEAERQRAIQGEIISNADVDLVRNLNRGQRAMLGMRTAAIRLTASFRAFFATLLTNPFTYIFAAISIGISAFNKAKERADLMNDRLNAVANQMSEFYDRIKEGYESVRQVIEKGLMTDSSIKDINEAHEAFDAMLSVNKDLEPIILRRIRHISDERQRLIELKKVWDEILESASTQAQPELIINSIGDTKSGLRGELADVGKRIESINGLLYRMPKYNALREWQDDFVKLVAQFRSGEIDIQSFRNLLTSAPGDNGTLLKYVQRLREDLDDVTKAGIKARNGIMLNIRQFDGAFPNLAIPETLGLSDRGLVDYQVWFQNQLKSVQWQLSSEGADAAMIDIISGWLTRTFQIGVNKADTGGINLNEWRKGLSEIMRSEFADDGSIIFGDKPLFTEKELEDMTSLEEAIKRLSGDWKEYSEQLQNVKNLSESAVARPDAIKDAKRDAAELGLIIGDVERAIRYLNAASVITPKENRTDRRISELMEELRVVKEASKRYKELQKVMSDDAAKSQVESEFRHVFNSFQHLSKNIAFDTDEVVLRFEEALKKRFLDKKSIISITSNKINIDLDGMADQIQEEFDRIANSIKLDNIVSSGVSDAESALSVIQEGLNNLLNMQGLSVIDFSLNDHEIIDDVNSFGKRLNSATRTAIMDYIKIRKDLGDQEIKNRQEYISRFGTYEQKRLGIIEKYDELIEGELTDHGKKLKEIEMQEELSKLDVSMIEQSEFWIRLFGDADRVTTNYIRKTIQQTQQLIDYLNGVDGAVKPTMFTDEQISELNNNTELVQKILKALERQMNEMDSRNPFQNIIDGIDELAKASKRVRISRESNDDGAGEDALNDQYAATQKLIAGLKGAADMAVALGGVLRDIGAGSGLSDAANVLQQAASMASTGMQFGPVGAVVGGVLGIVSGLVNANGEQERLNSRIEESARRVQVLEYAYEDLQRSIENAAGSHRFDLVGNLVKNLYHQSLEYEKQAALEREKGKDADESKIQELERSSKESLYAIQDTWRDLRDELLGGTFQSFSRDLASSMFDALSDGSKTAVEAWNDALDEILLNTMVNMLAVKLIEPHVKELVDYISDSIGMISDADASAMNNRLKEIDKSIAEFNSFDFRDISGKELFAAEIEKLMKERDQIVATLSGIDIGLNPDDFEEIKRRAEGMGSMIGGEFTEAIQAVADALGVSLNEGTNITGIQREVGQMTEDTALTLASIGNSMLYYQISMFNFMTAWNEGFVGETGVIPSMMAYQNNALAAINAIKADTARIVIATEQTAADLRSVIAPLGYRVGMAININ
jgi:hypothetical protein